MLSVSESMSDIRLWTAVHQTRVAEHPIFSRCRRMEVFKFWLRSRLYDGTGTRMVGQNIALTEFIYIRTLLLKTSQ